MKSFKNLLIAGMLIAGMSVLFSCEPEKPETEPPVVTPPDEILNGSFTLTTEELFVDDYGPETTTGISMKGEGDLNGHGISEMTLSHHETISVENNSVEITNGNMSILADSGSEIYGTYQEWGFLDPRFKTIEISVAGGTGEFSGATGKIKLRLVAGKDLLWTANVEGKLYFDQNPTL